VKTRQRRTPQQIVLNRPDGPCPCGSGKSVGLCCLQADGSLRIRPPNLHPPGDITGFAKAGCYLSTTSNCSHTSSGEHYISQSLLTEIGDTVSVGGFRWSGPTPETQKIVGINRLTANILCDRHNSSLSTLDDHAGKFMRILKAINHDLDNNAQNIPHDMNYLVSGEILESWMLKVLLGMFFSKNAVGPDGAVIETFPIDMDRAIRALYEASWDDKCGLYLAALAGEQINLDLSFGARVWCGLSKNKTYGAVIEIYGLSFIIAIDNLDGHLDIETETANYHPAFITFERGARKHRIVLTWAPPSTGGVTIIRPS
jgi:hypothetical protein